MKSLIVAVIAAAAISTLSGCSTAGITKDFKGQAESVQASNVAFCSGKGLRSYMEILDGSAMIVCKDGSTFWIKK